jgi:mRNA interferase MazF
MAIHKDFKGWAELKFNLQAFTSPHSFREREIWWAAIGHNVGDEEDGKGQYYSRPVLVIRKFNKNLFWGIPLTTTARTGEYYSHFRYKKRVDSTAILSQLRMFDARRLLRRDGTIDEVAFATIQLRLINIIRKEPQK